MYLISLQKSWICLPDLAHAPPMKQKSITTWILTMIKLSRREKVLVNILNKRLAHEIFFKLCKFTEQW